MNKVQISFKQLLILYCLLIFSTTVSAADVTEYTPAEITVLTENWLKQELAVSDDSETRIQVIPLDNRIGNKICQQQLQLSMPQGSSQRQSTVQISCPDELSWQLYIQVRISQIILATTLRQNIITGSRLTADTLQQEPRELRFIRGTPVTEPEQVIGARAKRAMSMGQIITLQDLCLVCRGDVVTITVDDNGLSVSATGIAQQDGTLGDTISVVNRQSNRTIKAEVTAVNTVKVKF